MIARLLGLGDVLVIGIVEGVGITQRLHRPDHVVRGYGRAVMEARLGPEAIGHHGAILGVPHAAGHQAIFGRGLIEGGCQQRVVLHGTARLALEGVGVEVVERADKTEAHAPALRGGRIHIVEVLEAGGILDVLEQGERVAEVAVFRVGHLDAHELGGRRKRGEPQQGAAGEGHGCGNSWRNGVQDKQAAPQKKTPASGLPVLNFS